MSETETGELSREELFSIIDELRADRAVGASLVNAARARADQDAAALRDMTADRDSWRNAAKNLQSELWRQIDVMRADYDQHGEQIAHLTRAINALLEIAQSRTADGEPVAERESLSELPPMPNVPPLTVSSLVAPRPVVDRSPIAMADNPLPEPPAADVEAMPSETARAATLKAFVPANDSDVVQHLIEKTPADYPDPPPVLDGDRVGIFTELAAVNNRPPVAPVPPPAAAEDESTEDGTGAAGPVDVLPTPVAEAPPKKRQLRRPRLTG